MRISIRLRWHGKEFGFVCLFFVLVKIPLMNFRMTGRFLSVVVFAFIGSTAVYGNTEVFLDRSEADIFPKEWRGEPVHAEADPLAEADRAGCLEVLERALALYPDELLKSDLKGVYALGGLRYKGVSAGGTRSSARVYLVKNPKYEMARFERNFHAEFSSILFLKHAQHFDEKAWREALPEGFEYQGSGVASIRDGSASLVPSEELNEIGFFHGYAQSSIEEDFNSFAANLFTGAAEFWAAVDRHPVMRKKAEIAMGFYQRLDNSFSNEFFASIRKQAIERGNR